MSYVLTYIEFQTDVGQLLLQSRDFLSYVFREIQSRSSPLLHHLLYQTLLFSVQFRVRLLDVLLGSLHRSEEIETHSHVNAVFFEQGFCLVGRIT